MIKLLNTKTATYPEKEERESNTYTHKIFVIRHVKDHHIKESDMCYKAQELKIKDIQYSINKQW